MVQPPALLAVDAGNTSLTVGLFRGRRLVRQGRLPTATAMERRGLGARIAACAGLGGNRDGLSGVIYASVVPALDRKLASASADRFRCAVFRVTPSSPVGLPLRVRRPAEVGADRIVNALAARELVGAPAVVVDIGTAVTVDCLTARGEYAGGAIMPGPGIAAEALRDRTAKLPHVEPGRAARAIGRDTVECIRAGLYFGLLGMIREVVERTLSEMGAVVPPCGTVPSCKGWEWDEAGGRAPRPPLGRALAGRGAGRARVILTGGYASLYQRGLGPDYCIMPDLTLQGLMLAHGILAGGGTR